MSHPLRLLRLIDAAPGPLASGYLNFVTRLGSIQVTRLLNPRFSPSRCESYIRVVSCELIISHWNAFKFHRRRSLPGSSPPASESPSESHPSLYPSLSRQDGGLVVLRLQQLWRRLEDHHRRLHPPRPGQHARARARTHALESLRLPIRVPPRILSEFTSITDLFRVYVLSSTLRVGVTYMRVSVRVFTEFQSTGQVPAVRVPVSYPSRCVVHFSY